MDFHKSFLSALQTNPALTKTISIQDYLPTPVSPPEQITNNLPFVQAYGSIHTTYPYYYEIAGLNSYCLLYTEHGSGTLIIDNYNYSLVPNTLALIDCNKNHRIEIKQSPWNYKVFFIKGISLPFLFHTLTENNGKLYLFALGFDIPDLIQKFYTKLDRNTDKFFLHAKMISDILLDLAIEKDRLEEFHTHISDYLVEIKKSFDTNYHNSFSLDALDHQYHISKYQICREFTRQFGTSPIQYLNRCRIAAAKEALRYTDKRINEIGRLVGFENTNHFIRLFKQQTGVTPMIYRKQPPAETNQ